MKRKATITIKKDNYAKSHKDGKEFISVDFWGHNEGCSSPCDDEIEAKKQIDYLLQRYKEYDIEIKDERVRQMTLC